MKYTLIFNNRFIFVYVLQLLLLIFVVTVNRDLRLISRLLLIKFYRFAVFFNTEFCINTKRGSRMPSLSNMQ